MKRLLLIALLGAAIVAAQDEPKNPYLTMGFANGRMWRDVFGEGGGIGYLYGMLDSVGWNKPMFPHSLKLSEIQEALNRFFSVPENRPIQIKQAMMLISKQADGEVSAEQLQKEIRAAREVAAMFH